MYDPAYAGRVGRVDRLAPMPNRQASSSESQERAEIFRSRSKLAIELAESATVRQTKEEFLRIATQWLMLAAELEEKID
jgi:hypothetical protein